jgi:hypothetical protein
MITYNQDFHTYIRANWSTISKEKGNSGKNPNEASARACSLYHNVLNNKELPFVVIGAGVRNDTQLTSNLGLVTSNPSKSNKKINHLGGAILGENPWSVLMNDVFMLGVVNCARDVFLALQDGKIPDNSIFWDEKKQILNPLGRELATLLVCGYQRCKAPDSLAIIFMSPNRCQEPSEITLKELRDRVSHIQLSDIQKFLKNKPSKKEEFTILNAKDN